MEEFFPNQDPQGKDQPPATPAASSAPSAPAAADGVAVKRSVLRVYGFGILSGGLYWWYWFYVTRKAVTGELNAGDNVGMQTLGLIVPILNIFIIYWLYRDIDKLYRQAGFGGFPALWFALAPVLAIPIAIVLVVTIVGIFLLPLLYLALLIIPGLVVSYLNKYWDKKTNGKAVEAKVTGAEIAVVVIGIALFVINLLAGTLTASFTTKKVNDYSTDELNKQVQKSIDEANKNSSSSGSGSSNYNY